MLQRERIVFYDLPTSPFCIKVRALLHHKGLSFNVVNALQPRHWLALHRRSLGKVPALQIDGRWVSDSTDIAYELDRLFPHAPLVPQGGRAAALSHAIEEWADESLYFVALHFLWSDPQHAGAVRPVFGDGLIAHLASALYRRRMQRQLWGQGTGRKSPAHVAADLRRHLLQANALLADAPFLLGYEPWLCDFALFGQLSFLLGASASRAQVQVYPRLLDFVNRMRILTALQPELQTGLQTGLQLALERAN